jgi:hypothetical protein
MFQTRNGAKGFWSTRRGRVQPRTFRETVSLCQAKRNPRRAEFLAQPRPDRLLKKAFLESARRHPSSEVVDSVALFPYTHARACTTDFFSSLPRLRISSRDTHCERRRLAQFLNQQRQVLAAREATSGFRDRRGHHGRRDHPARRHHRARAHRRSRRGHRLRRARLAGALR